MAYRLILLILPEDGIEETKGILEKYDVLKLEIQAQE